MTDEETLAYWKKRLATEDKNSQRAPVTISIVPDTLRWFLRMIEEKGDLK